MTVYGNPAFLEREREHLGHVEQPTQAGFGIVRPREVVVINWEKTIIISFFLYLIKEFK